jgi:hypothetical protein
MVDRRPTSDLALSLLPDILGAQGGVAGAPGDDAGWNDPLL